MLSVSAVVLAYVAEPWLERSVRAVLASEEVEADVVVVDNGCTDGTVERLEGVPGVTVLRPERNLGFAGGCNLGARHTRGEVLALVNGDAVVAPDALAALAEVAMKPDVGIATASVRLADEPHRLNSGGNDVHFLGFSWSGRFGEEASRFQERRDVAGASGAGMALRRDLWEDLGGFDDRYFAYHEDAELSLRCWQRGWRVVYVPEAVVVHRYEFSRNPTKYYLVERNRLVLVLTAFEGRTLALLAPALVVVEAAMLAVAVAGGWWRQKLAGWAWLARNRRWVLARRRQLQAERTVPDRELAGRLAARIEPGNYRLSAALPPLDAFLARYWGLVRRWL